MSAIEAYRPLRPSRTRMVKLRGLGMCLREWGDAAAPLLVMVHGYRDSSITFQFVIDALQRDWRVISMDWRGFGHSEWVPHGYWHQDYLGDLDALLEHVSPDAPVRLLGHSLGGNIANIYAGVRPQRIARVASLDGFGLRDRAAADLPAHLDKWLASWRRDVPHGRGYARVDDMAARLVAANPRLTMDRALFLAAHQHRKRDDGTLIWSFDPAHARPFATLHRVDEWAACWRAIACPVLWIGSDGVFPPSVREDALDTDWRRAQVKDLRFHRIAGAGHNLQHDEPAQVARLIEDFFAD